MSVEERIASLETEKLACMQQYDEAIQNFENLRKMQPPVTPPEMPEQPKTPRLRPIVAPGKPLSEIIIEDRGPR